MGLRDMYSAGDIIEYEGGGRDYLVSIEGEEGLWVNACNPSWIERGLRSFCDECYPFFSDRLYEGAEVVGHLGGAPSRMPVDGTRRTRRYIGAECVTMDGPSPFLTVVAYGDRRGADAHPRSPCPIGVKSWRTRTTKCS